MSFWLLNWCKLPDTCDSSTAPNVIWPLLLLSATRPRRYPTIGCDTLLLLYSAWIGVSRFVVLSDAPPRPSRPSNGMLLPPNWFVSFVATPKPKLSSFIPAIVIESVAFSTVTEPVPYEILYCCFPLTFSELELDVLSLFRLEPPQLLQLLPVTQVSAEPESTNIL